MSNKQLTYLRAGASAIITALAIVYAQYPSYTWITAVIAVGATLGIHAIPAISQNTEKGTVMSTPQTPDGSILMGVTPPVAPPVAPQPEPTVNPAPEPVSEAPEAPEAPEAVAEAPEETPQDAPGQTVAAEVVPAQEVSAQSPVTRTAPVDAPGQTIADRLRALADELDGS